MPNLAALLAVHEDELERHVATEFLQGHPVHWSLAQLAALAARWQTAFTRAGLQKGDRVAISARNSMQWLAVDQAALGLGLITVPIDPQASSRIAATVIAHSGADLLLIDSAGRANQIMQAGPSIQKIVILRVLQHGRSRLTSLEDFLPEEADGPFRTADLGEDELATLSYQRVGKDGIRGITLSHANLQASIHAQQASGLLAPEQTVLACGNFSELFHRVTACYLPLACGARVVLPNAGADLQDALATTTPEVLTIRGEQLQLIAQLLREPLEDAGNKVAPLGAALDAGIRAQQGSASWWDKLLYNAQSARLKLAVTQTTGGALRRVLCANAQPGAAIRQLHAQGVEALNGLSLACASGLVSLNSVGNARADTCGPCSPGVEASISPQGELLLRGLALSQAYWNDPAATQADFQVEGWVHTGHRARLESGHIMIEGFLAETAPQDTQQVPISHQTSMPDSTLVR